MDTPVHPHASAWLDAVAGSHTHIFDLGQPLSMRMPQWPAHPPFIFSLMRRHGDSVHADGTTGANELLVMCGHTGTHIDGLGHVCQNGLGYGGTSTEELQRGGQGIQRIGIETVPPIVRRGCLLDIASLLEVEELDPEHEISADELQRACERQSVEVQEGDAVLIRTGWGRLWPEPGRYIRAGRGLPGPNVDAARWLARQGIALTGSDTAVYEMFPPNPDAMPVHGVLIVESGIFIMENLNLEELARQRQYTFVFVALPLKIVGATGSPIRPVALA
jgi:kynurenine formamidase